MKTTLRKITPKKEGSERWGQEAFGVAEGAPQDWPRPSHLRTCTKVVWVATVPTPAPTSSSQLELG